MILALMMTGCNFSAASGFIGPSDTAMQDSKIQRDFARIPGEENLYYCIDTKVVYWIGGSYTENVIGADYTTSYMTAYYAPNGLPYIYNSETGQMEQIER